MSAAGLLQTSLDGDSRTDARMSPLTSAGSAQSYVSSQGDTKPGVRNLELAGNPCLEVVRQERESLTELKWEADAGRAGEHASSVSERQLGTSATSGKEGTKQPMAWEIDLTDLTAPRDLKRKRSAKGECVKLAANLPVRGVV